MKLLHRTSYSYLVLAIPIILISMAVFYTLVRSFNLKHVDDAIKTEHTRITKKFIEDELSDELFVKEISLDSVIPDQYRTINVFDKKEEQNEPFRELICNQKIAGKNYSITIRKSLVENTSLMYSISFAIFFLLLLMAGSFILLNRLLANRTWAPFKSILDNLSNYHVGNEYVSITPKLNIDEFKSLDKSIQMMVERINQEYFIQKEFIDIISHEYQTPLAVITNEVELLIQNPNLDEEDLSKIGRISQYVQRLSKMNQSLLLLSRIDNNQFDKTAKVELSPLLQKVIEDKEDQIEHRSIKIEFNKNQNSFITINSSLVEILCANLLQNAIRHNLNKGGLINIELYKDQLIISNTGLEKELNEADLFKKFYKNSQSKNSIGLGLSIIKSICDNNKIAIKYSYNQKTSMHSFALRF
jgi:signal transduction histidine kinase